MTVTDELPARLMGSPELLQRCAVLPQSQEVLRQMVTAHPPQRNGVLRKANIFVSGQSIQVYKIQILWSLTHFSLIPGTPDTGDYSD